MSRFIRHTVALFITASLTPMIGAAAADAAEVQALREQVRALEQQLKALARHVGLSEENSPAAAPAASRVTVNDKGYTLVSVEGANSIRFRGLVQADARQFFRDGGGIAN